MDAFYLPPDEVHVWTIPLDIARDEMDRLYRTLSEVEQERSARFLHLLDRQRFIAAHGAVRELLAAYLQIRSSNIRYAYNTFGKPSLASDGGERLKFNLSRSGKLAVLALAIGAEMGVDVERIREYPEAMGIAWQCFSTLEASRLEKLPKPMRTEEFFADWTLKEARLKAQGHGLGMMESALPAAGWSYFSLKPASGYIGALVIEGCGWRLMTKSR